MSSNNVRQSSPHCGQKLISFFLLRSFKESKYTTMLAFSSLQQLEEQHERKCDNILFNGLTVPVGRGLIIVEVSLPLIGQTSHGRTPLSEELVVAQRRDNTRHPHETGDHPNPRSQLASGRSHAGIGHHEPWPAVIDIKQKFDCDRGAP
jgi:hypothetical protein